MMPSLTPSMVDEYRKQFCKQTLYNTHNTPTPCFKNVNSYSYKGQRVENWLASAWAHGQIQVSKSRIKISFLSYDHDRVLSVKVGDFSFQRLAKATSRYLGADLAALTRADAVKRIFKQFSDGTLALPGSPQRKKGKIHGFQQLTYSLVRSSQVAQNSYPLIWLVLPTLNPIWFNHIFPHCPPRPTDRNSTCSVMYYASQFNDPIKTTTVFIQSWTTLAHYYATQERNFLWQ